MQAIKVCLLVATASTMSSDASSVNERMRLRGVEKAAYESQRRVQEKGEKKSAIAKESTVKEIANEIQELDDKIIKEEVKLDDEKSVKEQLKELKHAKEKGEKDVVNELTADLKTIDIVIKANEKKLKKDAKMPKEKKGKEEKVKDEKVKEEKVKEEKVMEEFVEKIHNVEVKEEIAFEELKTLEEEEIDSITIVNSKFLDTDSTKTVVPSSKPTVKPTTSPSVTPTLKPVTTLPEPELPTFSPTLAPSDLVVDDVTEVAGEMPSCPLAYDKTKTSYKVGDLVTITGNIFECMSPYAVYCNIAEWDEALTANDQNAEDNWNTAWKYVSPCSGLVTVIENSVSTMAPSTTLTSLPTFSPTAVPSAEAVITPEVVMPELEVDPMPTLTCPPVYDITKTNYVGGEKVLITDNIFECHTLHVYYCNVATWDDALLTSDPNAQEAWNSAWVYVGLCE